MDNLEEKAQKVLIRQFAKAKKNATELQKICTTINKGLDGPTIENTKDLFGRLVKIISSIPGTKSLREYIHGLRRTAELEMFPQQLWIHIEKGAYGIFSVSVAKEFERKRILHTLPIAIRMALKSDEVMEAAELSRKLEKWKKQFEIWYKEPAEKGVDMITLAKEIDSLSGRGANGVVEPLLT